MHNMEPISFVSLLSSIATVFTFLGAVWGAERISYNILSRRDEDDDAVGVESNAELRAELIKAEPIVMLPYIENPTITQNQVIDELERKNFDKIMSEIVEYYIPFYTDEDIIGHNSIWMSNEEFKIPIYGGKETLSGHELYLELDKEWDEEIKKTEKTNKERTGYQMIIEAARSASKFKRENGL
jgi:hypothetical protein